MSRLKHLKFSLLNSPFSSALAYLVLRAYTKTVSVKMEGLERVLDHLDRGGRVILCSWHQRFFAGFLLPRMLGRPVAIMISQSDDGDVVSAVTRRIGWLTVRGSSSRGGRKALREMIRLLKQHGLGVHVVDGPGGPARRIKPGVVILARHADAVMCPVYVHYENARQFTNSWDRFMVPRPGSSALIRFGPLIPVPERLDTEELERTRLRVEEDMIRGHDAPEEKPF